MARKLFLILSLLWLIFSAFSCSSIKETFLGTTALAMDLTKGGGFIIAGEKFADTDGGLLIVKTDTEGAVEWERTYGYYGNEHFSKLSIIQCIDGGYAVAGSKSTDNSSSDGIVLKLDSAGSIEWEKTFGGSDYDHFTSILQTQDEGYVVAGTAGSTDLTGASNESGERAFVIKMDSSGSIEWQQRYDKGGIDSIIENERGNYVYCGTGPSGTGDELVSEIGPAGDVIWASILTERPLYDIQSDTILELIGTGYIVASILPGDQLHLIKLGLDGSLVWDRTVDDAENGIFAGLDLCSDGGYIVCGGRNASPAGYIIVKLDSEGVVQWQLIRNKGVIGSAMAYSVRQIPDEGYIVSGTRIKRPWFPHKAFLLKLDANGTVLWEGVY
jgi:hypothetical protein